MFKLPNLAASCDLRCLSLAGSTKGKRYYATEEDDLGAPLAAGWKRETTIREYTKSGIRGEVVYVAPCGKRFKQYPDIIRVSKFLKITK